MYFASFAIGCVKQHSRTFLLHVNKPIRLEKMLKSKDWVVWCRSRKRDEQQRPFEVDGKGIFSNCSKQAKPKAGEKTDKKGGKGRQCAGKRGDGRATSNAQWAKSMLRAGFTQIAMWQTNQKQL